MPKYAFSWNHFSDSTIRTIAVALGYRYKNVDEPVPRAWLSQKFKRPNDELVQRAKKAIEETWLAEHPYVAEHIVACLLDRGIGPGNQPVDAEGYLDYIRKSRNSKKLRQLILDHLLAYGENRDYDGVRVPPFAVLHTAEQSIDPRQAFPYQIEAWHALDRALSKGKSCGQKGILEMPTGSGKTFTAVRWLLGNIVSGGGRVLWIAHRYELLEQAAMQFHALAGLAGRKEQLRVRIVSGMHCSMTQVNMHDDVIVCSIGSLARRMDIGRELLSDPNLFVVIDEAHHSVAKTYRDIVKSMSPESRGLLGLTATPTRTVDEERSHLATLFGNNTIYQIKMRTLIEQGFLARPIPVRVKTEAAVEEGLTLDDIRHVVQFREISEAWLDRIATMEIRNQVIVRHYLENRKKYGKTLIFAINVAHAVLLKDMFVSAGVHSDYVASYREAATDKSNHDIIDAFRDPESGLDVLVNVQILTEGVDIPNVKTVFLARPTISEILLRQMVGRALRGSKCGGSKEAYLVSFEDHWMRFRDFECPFPLLGDYLGQEDDLPESRKQVLDRITEGIPWEVIRHVAVLLRAKARTEMEIFESVPHGWYILPSMDGVEYTIIPVYEHQKACWDALYRHIEESRSVGLSDRVLKTLAEDYFGDCDDPKPSTGDIDEFITFIAGGGTIDYEEFTDRKRSDPKSVAAEIMDRDMTHREQLELVEERYKLPLVAAIYQNARDYHTAVSEELYYLAHPDERLKPVRGEPIFNSRPVEGMRPGPAHDLVKLTLEMLDTGRGILGTKDVRQPDEVVWSKRLIKGWYGMAYYGEPSTKIKINCLLDSQDISSETIKFLLWHEYLHIYLLSGHTPEFRKFERDWPGYMKADRELDTLNERFGVQYW